MSLHGSVGGRVSPARFTDTKPPVCLQKCAEIVVAHLGYLNYTQYMVTVGFEHLDVPVREMNFTVSTPADLACSRGSFVSARSSDKWPGWPSVGIMSFWTAKDICSFQKL